MLKKLRLENFRCFRDHEIPFRPRTVIVGRNNAGKSTVVEALRLVAIIAERYKTVSYSAVPEWLEIFRGTRGIIPSLDNQAFNFERVFHQHGDPPAKITATFLSGESVEIYIGPDNAVFGVVRDRYHRPLTSKGDARRAALPLIGALPQVAPVRFPEPVLGEDYVRRSLNSALAPSHFRNQIAILHNCYPEFKKISEETWRGLLIQGIRRVGNFPEISLELDIRNEDFVADVSWMGHGLQMWLQTMWFLARTKSFDVVILDEPDVYMHADLQRKLVRFMHTRHPQFIVATHSVEILSEIEPEDVLVLDRGKRAAQFAIDWPEIQQVISHVGGVHNISLARLTHARKCLMVEGEDLDLLRRFHDKLFPESDEPLQSLPVFSIGGWGGWDYVLGSSMWISQTFGDVKIYCALDRDFHTEEQISARSKQALLKNIELVVWSKKELENYLLVPAAIVRLIKARAGDKKMPPSNLIDKKLAEICESLKSNTIEELAGEIQATDRGVMYKTATARARSIVDNNWNTLTTRLAIVSGKKVLSELGKWLQENYKISISAGAIANSLEAEEIAGDIRDFLESIEYRQSLGYGAVVK